MSNNLIGSYNEFIFDLDNTLINENDYLFEGYKYIEITINNKQESQLPIFNFLKNNFENSGRANLFDLCLEHFNLPKEYKDMMLNCLRTVGLGKPLQLCNNVVILVNILLENKKPIFVITNGNPIQQRNKVSQIAWPKGFEIRNVYFANEYQPKPNPAAFQKLNSDFILKNPVYIGDSIVDERFAINCQIPFLHISQIQ